MLVIDEEVDAGDEDDDADDDRDNHESEVEIAHRVQCTRSPNSRDSDSKSDFEDAGYPIGKARVFSVFEF